MRNKVVVNSWQLASFDAADLELSNFDLRSFVRFFRKNKLISPKSVTEYLRPKEGVGGGEVWKTFLTKKFEREEVGGPRMRKLRKN